MTRFVDFPYDFDPKNNLFLDALQTLLGFDENLDRDDLTFVGCYPEISLLRKIYLFTRSRLSNVGMTNWLNHQKGISSLPGLKGKKVWITFENRRIPSEGADLTISFDLDNNNGRNLYFPLLFNYIDFLSTNKSYVKHKISFEELKQSRIDIGMPLEKRKFACAFINNPDPVRLRFINELRQFGPVDLYGRHSGNYVENKIEISNNYLLSVCFENDLFPGYITEKPLEAWLGKSVPIYWGQDSAGLLNPKAIVNLVDSVSFRDSARGLYDLTKDTTGIEQLIREPLIASEFPKPDLLSFLGQILE